MSWWRGREKAEPEATGAEINRLASGAAGFRGRSRNYPYGLTVWGSTDPIAKSTSVIVA